MKQKIESPSRGGVRVIKRTLWKERKKKACNPNPKTPNNCELNSSKVKKKIPLGSMSCTFRMCSGFVVAE